MASVCQQPSDWVYIVYNNQQQHVLHFIPCHVATEGNFNDQTHTHHILLFPTTGEKRQETLN